MIKNEKKVMYLHKYDTDGRLDHLSSGVTLLLEVGDKVNMQIPKGYKLYDDADDHSIFSGFLLFVL